MIGIWLAICFYSINRRTFAYAILGAPRRSALLAAVSWYVGSAAFGDDLANLKCLAALVKASASVAYLFQLDFARHLSSGVRAL